MILLNEVLDIDLLHKMLNEGYIRVGTHPDYPELKIYGYTQQAQFANLWNDVTRRCRGLITATEVINGQIIEHVIARGFDKFFNVNTTGMPETLEENLPLEEPIWSTKMDGSLGINYFWDNKIHVATRGSFVSEQANWATKWLREKNPGLTQNLYKDSTLVSEIIYTSNQIVVNYDFEGLVALSLIDNLTGKELSRSLLEEAATIHGMMPVALYSGKNIQDAQTENVDNFEGYIVTFQSTGLKIKIKLEEYCRLHRIVTGLNPRAVWEKLMAGDNIEITRMIADKTLGEGFRFWLEKWYCQLISDFNIINREVRAIYDSRPTGLLINRKDLALYFTKPENARYSNLLFALADGKDPNPLIWKRLRPFGNETFRADGEA